MGYYIGLDVSQRQTAICIIDGEGSRQAEGKALTTPIDIHDWITKQVAPGSIVKVSHEAGSLSNWLHCELTKLGLPMICLESYQTAKLLETQRNKTDKNDARGLAELVRMGGSFIKGVVIRSQESQEVRALLTMRQNLVQQRVSLENNITGMLKPFGFLTARGNISTKIFRERVLANLVKADDRGLKLRGIITPSLETHDHLCKQLAVLSRQVEITAKANPVCRRLMTAPGVGPIVALSFFTAIDDPRRFSSPGDVGAYFGLTPKQYQSGETDIKKGTSRRGDTLRRSHLVQAATVLLIATKTWCPLKAWGIKIAKRHGVCKARVAVARKLAIILHRMWMREQDFCWTNAPADTALARQKLA
jgi:transposase